MTQESEAPIKLPSATVVKALFAEANKVKEQLSSISGSFGDRIKTQIEIGNLCGPAFRQAASIFKKARNNELKAKEHLYHLRAYLDWVEEDMFNKGHVGDLASMAENGDDEGGEAEDQAETAAEAADRIFTEQNRAAAGEALDLDNLKDQAPAAPADEPAKPKGRGGRKKAVEAQTEVAPPAPSDDEAPPAPSSDFEDDIRPAFLRRREEEREAGSVH